MALRAVPSAAAYDVRDVRVGQRFENPEYRRLQHRIPVVSRDLLARMRLPEPQAVVRVPGTGRSEAQPYDLTRWMRTRFRLSSQVPASVATQQQPGGDIVAGPFFAAARGRIQRLLDSRQARNLPTAVAMLGPNSDTRAFLENAVLDPQDAITTYLLTFPTLAEARQAQQLNHHADLIDDLIESVTVLIRTDMADSRIGGKYVVTMNSHLRKDGQDYDSSLTAPPIPVVVNASLAQIRRRVADSLRDDRRSLFHILDSHIVGESGTEYLGINWVSVTKVGVRAQLGVRGLNILPAMFPTPEQVAAELQEEGLAGFYGFPGAGPTVPLPHPWDSLTGHASPFVNVEAPAGDTNCFFYAVMSGYHHVISSKVLDYTPDMLKAIQWPVDCGPVPNSMKLYDRLEELNPNVALSVYVIDAEVPFEATELRHKGAPEDPVGTFNRFYNTVHVLRLSDRSRTPQTPDMRVVCIAYFERRWHVPPAVPGSKLRLCVRGHFVGVKSASWLLQRCQRAFVVKDWSKRRAHACPRCAQVLMSTQAYGRHIIFCQGGATVMCLPPVCPKTKKPPLIRYKPKDFTPPIVAFYDFEAFDVPRDEPTQRGTGTTIIADQYPAAFCLRGIDVATNETVFAYDFPQHDQDGCPIPGAQNTHGFNSDIATVGDLEVHGLYGVAKHFVRACVYMRAIAERLYPQSYSSAASAGGDGATPWLMPAYAHNAGRYDDTFVLKAAAAAEGRRVNVLARNGRTMITVQVGDVVFLDSALFLPSSLDANLRSMDIERPGKGESEQAFVRRRDASLRPLRDALQPVMGDQWPLMCHKGLFLYEAFSSYEALANMQGQWPEREAFATKLGGGKKPDQSDWERCGRVFSEHCGGDWVRYMMLYCIADTTQLASVMLNFRRQVRESFGVEFFDYITAPSLFWAASLKGLPSNVEGLEMLTDERSYRLIRRAIVGGTACVVGAGSCQANFPEMGPVAFKPDQPRRCILLLDINAMYGTAMHDFPMPYADFEYWADGSACLKMEPFMEALMAWTADSSTGFFVEVDCHLPLELHDRMRKWPLLPGHYAPRREDLSEEQAAAFSANDRDRGQFGGRRLCMHLLDMRRQVFHVVQLQHAVTMGYVVTRVHSMTTFRQARIYTDYVRSNIEARKEAKTTDVKNMRKAANNYVYGYSIRNPEAQMHAVLINSDEELSRVAASPMFRSIDYIGDGVAIADMQRPRIRLQEPIYIGAAILAFSKVMIATAVYRFIDYFASVGLNFEPHYTDTDSVAADVDTDWQGVRQWLLDDRTDPKGRLIDTSSIPVGVLGFDDEAWLKDGAGELGLFKLEYLTSKSPTGGGGAEVFDPVVSAEWLMAKTYNYERLSGMEDIKAKGVPNGLIRELADHETFQKMRLSSADLERGPDKIHGITYRLDTSAELSKQRVAIRKVALTCRDVKCRVEDAGMTRRPFGYYADRIDGVSYYIDGRTFMPTDKVKFTTGKVRQAADDGTELRATQKAMSCLQKSRRRSLKTARIIDDDDDGDTAKTIKTTTTTTTTRQTRSTIFGPCSDSEDSLQEWLRLLQEESVDSAGELVLSASRGELGSFSHTTHSSGNSSSSDFTLTPDMDMDMDMDDDDQFVLGCLMSMPQWTVVDEHADRTDSKVARLSA